MEHSIEKSFLSLKTILNYNFVANYLVHFEVISKPARIQAHILAPILAPILAHIQAPILD
jgi:hypothetical protein